MTSLPKSVDWLGDIHAQAATTHRCAHLAADPVKEANERVGATILELMNGASGKVVPLRRPNP